MDESIQSMGIGDEEAWVPAADIARQRRKGCANGGVLSERIQESVEDSSTRNKIPEASGRMGDVVPKGEGGKASVSMEHNKVRRTSPRKNLVKRPVVYRTKIADLIPHWTDQTMSSHRPISRADVLIRFGRFVKFLTKCGIEYPDSVTPIHVARYIKDINTRIPLCAYKEWGPVKSFFKWCLGSGYVLTNVTDAVRSPTAPPPKIREPWTRDEFRRMIQFADMNGDTRRALKGVVMFGYYCGMSWKDACTVKWGEIHYDDMTVRKQRSKTGTLQVVPFERNGELYNHLEWVKSVEVERNLQPDENVSGLADCCLNTILRQWFDTRRAAGLEHHDFHDLRTTFATDLIKAGANVNDAMTASGHRTLTAFAGYIARQKTDRAREVIARVRGSATPDAGEEVPV